MKIIHCADLHLDSPMTTNLNREKAAERKNELLGTFSNMADYAEKEGVRAVIIAGDLFDRDRVSASARNIVYGVMESHPDIYFFYLRGNHDTADNAVRQTEKPANLRLFGAKWTSYKFQEDPEGVPVVITGMENRKETGIDYDGLRLQSSCMNIVVLHGQLSVYGTSGRPDDLDFRRLSGCNIDYLALGHIHEYRTGALPPQGVYCYPGCLEGRGFDETGEHGFVLMEIDPLTGAMEYVFVPFAMRRLYEIPVDISGCMTTADISGKIRETLRGGSFRRSDMVKILLQGEVGVECEKNIDYLEQHFRDMFYVVRMADESRLVLDDNDYAHDLSLKGEFVRLVRQVPDLRDQEKAEIIRCGLQALNEEEICL